MPPPAHEPPNKGNGRGGEAEKYVTTRLVENSPLYGDEDTGESPSRGESPSQGASQGASQGDSQTERRGGSRRPPPTKRQYAIRHYYGIGPGGELIEDTPTKKELAAELDVSRQTIYKWVNRESIPLVDGWSQAERWTLYACAMTGDEEALEEYLAVQRLLERSGSRRGFRRSGSDETEPDGHVMAGFDEDFNPW